MMRSAFFILSYFFLLAILSSVLEPTMSTTTRPRRVQSSRALLLSSNDIGPEQWRVSGSIIFQPPWGSIQPERWRRSVAPTPATCVSFVSLSLSVIFSLLSRSLLTSHLRKRVSESTGAIGYIYIFVIESKGNQVDWKIRKKKGYKAK